MPSQYTDFLCLFMDISGLKLGVEWNYAAFYGLAPEFGQNYEHFGQKCSVMLAHAVLGRLYSAHNLPVLNIMCLTFTLGLL